MTAPTADALVQTVLDARARRDPAWATQVGLAGRDGALRAASREAYEEDALASEALLARVRALPASHDRDVLESVLALEIFEVREVRTHLRNPDLAASFFDHLLAILLATHLPPSAAVAALTARLDAAPTYFREGWARFDAKDVPRAWAEAAKRSVAAAPAFFGAVRTYATTSLGSVPPALAAALARAETLVAQHGRFLDGLIPACAGREALGEARFAQLLTLRHVEEDAETLREQGEALVLRFRRDVEEAARTVLAEAGRPVGDDPVADALALVQADHPATFADVLAFHVQAIDEARAFVAAKGLAEVPPTPLAVVETPEFLRHLIPFAAYVPPARFATPAQGTYLVTPKVDLGAFARADVRNTTVHEAYPGHHLQLSMAATRAPLAAYLADAPDLAEGWALYCEDLMGRHGYTATPADRFVRSRDALWRAVRIVLDVGLHAFDMPTSDAVSRLVRETGMTVEEAEAEVLRYTQAPAYNLSYMWGRIRIEALRKECLAAGLSEKAFHDRLVAEGTIPLALLERRLRSGFRESSRTGSA